MNGLSLASLSPLLLDIVLVLSATVLVLLDSILPAGAKRSLGYVALAELLACLAGTFFLDLTGPALGGSYVGDPLALLFKQVFLAAGALAVLGSLHRVDRDFPRRQGEYYQLLLFSLAGMSLLAGARDLILLVVAFELMGIPLYVLASYAKTGKQVGPLPAESGLKLYIVGAVSSAIALYGLGLVYGMAGSTSIQVVAQTPWSPLLGVGMALILAGFGFKIGVVPFHMWVPDTYQGTSTPFAGFLSVAPKGAGFVALIQLLVGGFGRLHSQWVTMLVVLIVATLTIGNLMALRQTNLKRLLGFSGVAHVGFMLMGLVSVATVAGTGAQAGAASEGLASIMFYLVGYLASNMGLFMIVEAVAVTDSRQAGGNVSVSAGETLDSIDSFAGLARRSPWVGAATLLFLLSLAGIPFVVGFWSKLYVLIAAWRAGLEWLVILAATLSVVGLFYYLQIARAIYMRGPVQETPVEVTPALRATIVLCLAATVGMGLYPAPFIEAARQAAAQFVAAL